MKRLFFVLAVFGALAFAPQAFAKTLLVDKDRVQCPRADFQSIQAAVVAAVPGDTIKVCPDLYTESVNVFKPALTVVGASTADGCTIVRVGDPTRDSIVTGGASFAFSLANNNITLSGFVVQNSNIGILTSDGFSGYRITDNIAQFNSSGINFNSGGSLGLQSRVDHNCLRSNSVSGLQSEVVAPATSGNLKNALVDHNNTYQNGFAGLDFTGAGQRSYVTVTENSSVEDGGPAVSMDNSIGTSIDHNNALRTPRTFTQYGAITLGGANNSPQILNNTVQDGVGNGINFNQGIFAPVFPPPTVGANVSGNQITHTGASAILLFGTPTTGSADFSFFSNNNTTLAGIDGIRVQQFNNNNRFENNDADKNNQHGIRSEAGASANTYADNHMYLNVVADAEDDNRPANTWTNNHCDTDIPPGTICGVP